MAQERGSVFKEKRTGGVSKQERSQAGNRNEAKKAFSHRTLEKAEAALGSPGREDPPHTRVVGKVCSGEEGRPKCSSVKTSVKVTCNEQAGQF